jgi:phosphatidylglycerol:prolipoprotein diacylglycerol transferase
MRLFLFDFGGFTVRSDTAMLSLAASFGLFIGPLWAKRLTGIDAWVTFRVYCLLGLAALIGGRLHFVYNHQLYPFLTVGRMPWQGIHAGGAIIGMLVAAPAIFAYFRLGPGRVADALMPTVGLGVFIARVGCFLNGCCHGIQCSYAWCLSFPPGSPAAVDQAQQKMITYAAWSLPVHPLQLYFAAAGLAITAVALWLLPRKRYQGQVTLVGLLIFALAAYWLEPLRHVSGFRPYVGGVPQLQVVAGWLTRITIAALVACEVGHRMLARRVRVRATAA